MTYQEIKRIEKIQKTREILNELPEFVGDFFRGISVSTVYNTQYAYALDIKVFFEYLDIVGIKVEVEADLDQITARDLEKYLEYISVYEKNNRTYKNDQKAKSRKIATLRKFYEYYFKREKIKTNPAIIIEKPKIKEKVIVALEPHEIANLLDMIESGEGLTEHQKRYHEKVKLRDLAIVTLMLGTGIRISECIGIDLDNIDFNQDVIKITVKGQDERNIYFSKEVEKTLKRYLEDRGKDECSALFVTKTNKEVKRIGLRTVQDLVKKYSEIAVGRGISPHKLRSSFATGLYAETGDIGLVADCLGHKNVNTTKKHYAKAQEERRRRILAQVKLREE